MSPREAALSQARWQAILETARDAIISIDPTGVITLFNPMAQEIFGYSADEAIGRDVSFLMPSPYREKHAGYIREYQKTGVTRAIGRIREVEGRRKNGEVFPLQLSVGEAAVGDEVLYTAIIRDVTKEKQAEDQLRESEERYRTLFETTHDLVQSCDPDGRFAFVNAGWRRALGYSEAQIAAMDVFETLHSDSIAHCREVIKRVLNGATVRDVQVRFVAADGRVVEAEGHVAPRVVHGEVVATQGIFRDVTERKRADAEIAKARRIAAQRERLADVGALSAKIVHDIGNPIAGLYMSAQNIQRRLERDGSVSADSIGRPVDRILTTVNNLNALVSEFKQFLQEQRLDLVETELGVVLVEVVSVWEEEAKARGIALRIAGITERIVVHADQAKLRRVIDNLVKNALEAIRHGPGEVRLEAKLTAGDKVRIVVEDTGPGIAEGVDVFALFETTKPEGSGLGLAIAKQIVVAHGGHLSHEPREPHGTRFVIDLPRRGPATL